MRIWRFISVFGAFVLALEAVLLLLLGYAWIRRLPRTNLTHNDVPLWDSLVLGWSLFLGSRLVFTLMGGISTHTRQNYGASMGVAVAVVAIMSSVIRAKQISARLRATAGVMVLAVVFVLGWTSAAIGIHYVKTTEAEAQTIRTFDRWIAASPLEWHGLTIVVVAAKNAITPGELSYSSEDDGNWLRYAIKRVCRDCNAVVAEEVECIGKKSTIILPAAHRRQMLGDGTVLFRWTGKDLVFESAGCQ